MKSAVILFISMIAFTGQVLGQDHGNKIDSVEVMQDFRNLYRYQNFYIGGQPSYETMIWLRSHGVKKIINLRSERENTDFTGTSFNEEVMARKSGMEYCQVPVDGLKDYTPQRLNDLTGFLNRNDTILIHCASGYRATDFFMAYLIRDRGYTVNDAVEIGKKLKFTMPLEKLLDTRIRMDLLK
jgi:protein tyrosine phosphatase (PTP) superfamily phosphohydrolase (DUF442 family)